MIESLKAKNGLEVKKINGFLTHSLYNPKKEAVKFVKNHLEDVHVHIIYGYGSGYIVDEFLRNNPFKTFYIVIDPFIDISNKLKTDFVKYIYLKDLSDLIPSISQYIGDLYKNVKITCSLNYDKMNNCIYRDLLREIKSYMDVNKINENTVVNVSHLWYMNYLRNLRFDDCSIVKLNKISSKSVIVASGGPSLTKQLPLLKKYRKNFILISAGSTTNSLIQEGIIPDIVVSVDGHILNYKHFEHLDFKDDTLFVYSMYSYPKIREHFKKACYFVDGTGVLIGGSLEKIKQEETVVLSGGGSVAHYALLLATYISTGAVCLIGQDLAYLNGQSHAENNILGKKLNDNQLKSLIEVEGYYGDTVLTNHVFLSMKKSFETIAQSINNREVFNCTEGGALIKGMENRKFKDFCETYQSKEVNLSEKLEVSSNNSQKNPLEVSKVLLIKYKEVKKILKENLELITKAKNKRKFTDSILKKLNKNDELIKEIVNQDVSQVAFHSVVINTQRNFKKDINDTQIQKFKKSIEENNCLYNGMNEIIELGIKTLQKNVKELEAK